MIINEVADEIVLLDVKEGIAEGKALDMKQNSKRIVQAVLVVAYYHKAFAPGRDIVLVYNMVTSVVDVIVNKLYVAVQ
jgi:malate/lactate dehydrogenase